MALYIKVSNGKEFEKMLERIRKRRRGRPKVNSGDGPLGEGRAASLVAALL